ncbi:conserved hypothetical protein [Leishmania major strain Friedlin]|uniref:Uncharacterized protein n=1 Tax=Leishmania major TaxID=5664 RepID=Q4QCQ3_LEIMA|nr:conserved hypothetical protein [Leishmania major strain Friedlin]CAG9573216.1 hypothetical_protein_-_conserved [Leishmania major strain Friedlin]CAJ04360.1 conserved hypothetical protein [Leishmania major strain Friedlin]|eukprot:XP_001682895.1 conserved hypothetical protein [Leishmania major strain Friedlin]
MDLAMVPESVAGHAGTRALQPPPLTQLDGTASGASAAPASLSPVTLHVNWNRWGASLPPIGYTVSQRNLGGAPAGDGGKRSRGQASHEHIRGDAVAGQGRPSFTAPLPESAHRGKRRRTEHTSFTSLLKEVFMYLDSVSSTQQQPDHGCISGNAEEDEEGSLRQTTTAPSYTTASCYTSASPAVPPGARARNDDSSGPVAAAPAPLMSVDSAVQDTVRVLQQCWEYRGSPHDAFEPVRLLSPITVHLLLTYGHHIVTHDGQYMVLRGGAEHLPWAGCLYSILLTYVYRRRVAPATTAAADNGERGGSVTPALDCVSRLLLLNCHSFGWLNHTGSGEYECSHRRLYQAREALLALLEDPRYTALGRPAGCPLCASSMLGSNASTLILLGDTIVMEGGVPSLGLAHPRDTFTAHYQYGCGIACCVPEKGGGLQLDATGAPVVAGRGAYTPTSGRGLCAAHREPPRPAAMQASCERHRHLREPHSAPSVGDCLVEEDSPTLVRPGDHGHDGPWSGARSSSLWLSGTGAAPCRLPPVCCGVCRAAGVLGQAVLLGPTGPLVIHLQFDEREWFDMSARAVHAATTQGWLSAATAETTAVCPPPSSHLASQYASHPASALAAVLYAVLQGESTVGLTVQHYHASLGDHRNSSPHVGDSVPLAEFVEWLVWLLNAPPPALVVEWHPSTSTSAITTTCNALRCGGVTTPSSSCDSGVASGSQVSLSSPCSPIAHPHSPLAPFLSSATAFPNLVDLCAATGGSNSSFKATRVYGSDEGHATASLSTDHQQHGGYLNSPSASHGATTTFAPLGMLAQPRRSTVMQLLETYIDVVQSRAAMSAPPAATSSAPSVGRARTLPFTAADGTSGHIAEAMKPHLLLDWLLAVQESLRPCEATSLFDGVERPLVLAKELEVATEAERLLNASSVATSLQFRPRTARL